MTSYLRNPLIAVWALLTTVTVVSWLTARDGGAAHQLNVAVTVTVLALAAVKTFLVIWHFMEVRQAPVWLRATTAGWLIGLFALLLAFYLTAR